jgi:hypothetical protein
MAARDAQPTPIERLMTEKETRAARVAEFLRGLDAREQSIAQAERDAAARLLATGERPQAILKAAEHALSSGEDFRRYRLDVLPSEQAIACHEGCHWCCYLKVGASAPEVFALVEYLNEHASSAVLAHIKARVAELAADPRIFSQDAKIAARIPCALLSENGGCLGYEARPLACRGWTSTDADSCRRGLDDDSEPPLLNPQLVRECAAVGLGLAEAASDHGLSGEMLELTAALNVALNEADALVRWASGAEIFAAARADR